MEAVSSLNLESKLESATQALLNLASNTSYNTISDNCLYLMSEIRVQDKNAFEAAKLRKKENDKKVPVTIDAIMPSLLEIFDQLYEIDLLVYKSRKSVTIIDIQVFLKSSLDLEFRKTVVNKPPGLHCKVAIPFWLDNKKEKFDINWEHNTLNNQFRRLLMQVKWKLSGFR